MIRTIRRWCYLIKLYWEFPARSLEYECIVVDCWRPWIYDGLCKYHWNRDYSD